MKIKISYISCDLCRDKIFKKVYTVKTRNRSYDNLHWINGRNLDVCPKCWEIAAKHVEAERKKGNDVESSEQ